MMRIIAPLAGFATLAFCAGSALAASPAYCALYAQEYVNHAAVDSQGSVPVDHIHDRDYHKCLNMDDEPVLPTAYADPATDGIGGPYAMEQGSADTIVEEAPPDETPANETAALAADEPAVGTRSTGRWRGSGYAQWSPEWRQWCAEHFPNSFDRETGTIIPYETGVRTMCE